MSYLYSKSFDTVSSQYGILAEARPQSVPLRQCPDRAPDGSNLFVTKFYDSSPHRRTASSIVHVAMFNQHRLSALTRPRSHSPIFRIYVLQYYSIFVYSKL